MPRTLPWLESSNKSKAAKLHSGGTERKRAEEPESDNGTLPPQVPPSRRAAMSRSARTPSTSPPPEPPSEEFMIDGLENDDIYIMVEDEFYAMARKFTQHLHHAEYLRLTSLAKSRHASTITTLSRPTDSITTMKEETKKKREREAKTARQKAGLDQVLGRSTRESPEIDEEEDKEGSRIDDLWAGTTLHGLMTSPSRKNTSLMGLQKVKSSTRAAAGFSMPQVRDSQPTQSSPGQEAMEITDSRKTKPAKIAVQEPASEDDSNTAEDDDDLDALVGGSARLSSPSRFRKPPRPVELKKRPLPSYSSLSAPREVSIRPTDSPKIESPVPGKKKSISADDDLDTFLLHAISTPYSKRVKRKAGIDLSLEKNPAENIGCINEIPIFLV